MSREEGRERPLTEYQDRFHEHRERVAYEHARLSATVVRGGGAAPDLATDERVGPYRLLAPVGRGGQGTVWRAEDTRVGRTVALKLLSSRSAWTSEARRRFRREVAIAARLEHPAICTVFDAELDGERPYVAMRFVEGETLQRRIERAREDPRALPVVAAVRAVEEAANALAAAHAAGVVHRDVKPGNLMITPAGTVVVLDFGLARETAGEDTAVTRTGDVFGTPAYMAPEQIEGRPADARTDVWALGVTLYEALALEQPFREATRESLYRAILAREPAPPRRAEAKLSRDLAVIVATALAKEPARRYASARELTDDLAAWRAGRPIAARPVGPLGRALRWSRREPGPALLAAGLGLAVLGAAALGGYLVAQRQRLAAGATVLAQRERQDLVRDVSVGSIDGEAGAARLRAILEDDPRLTPQRASLVCWLASRARTDEALELCDAAPADRESPRVLERARVFALRHAARFAEADALEERLGPPADASEAFMASFAFQASEKPDAARRALEAIRLAIFLMPGPNEAYLEQLILCAKPLGADDDVAVAARALELGWPESEQAWFHIAYGFSATDQERSYAASRRAVALGMRHGPLLVGMHLHEMDLGQYARARATFEQGIALCEEDKLYPSWLVRAESCVKHAQLQDALAAADAALTLRPGEADPLLVRIRALRGLGRDREADLALDRLYEVDAARADAFLLSGE